MELPAMKVNPWDVDTLDVYLHYCCPECDHKSKTKLLFVNHAFSCHPDAKGPSMSLPNNFNRRWYISTTPNQKDFYTVQTNEIV